MRRVRVLPRIVAIACALGGSDPELASVAWAQEQRTSLSPEAQELIKQLETKDTYTRQRSFMRLEALREPATAPIIHQYVKSRNADTRAFSARALAAIEGAQAVPTLRELARRDRSPRVRLAAVLALEPLQDPQVLPILIEKLRDRSPEVRMAAVDAVSRVDDVKARESILLRWRRERHRDVRRVLREAVDRLGGP